MITMRTLSATLLLGGLLLATSGCQTYRMYDGPKQPSKSIARIEAVGRARVLSIDNRVVPIDNQKDTWLTVLPGEHDVEVTSWEYDYRTLDQTNGTRYVGRVILTPETTVHIKTVLRAGSSAEVQYSRGADQANFTVVEKETGQLAGSMTAKLVATAAPKPVYYYQGPIFIGPPPPMIWAPVGPPPFRP
jgi:hypothetical protein